MIVPLMAAYFFLMTGFSILSAFFAIFTEDRFGYNASANGYIFATIGLIVAVVVQGALDRAFGEKFHGEKDRSCRDWPCWPAACLSCL